MLSRRKRRSPTKSVGSAGSSSDDPAPDLPPSSPDTATLSSFSNRSSVLLAAFEQYNVLEVLHEDDAEGKKVQYTPEIAALQNAYTRFCSKSGPLKTNVLRMRLLPFLRTSLVDNLIAQPASLSPRLLVFQRWWSRLLNDVSAASAADRAAYYEAISALMARPEWLSAPALYGTLLESTVAHTVERVGLGSAVSLALGALLGKVLAYAFFYCPGVADPLLYLLHPKQSSLDRLAKATLPPSSEPRLTALRTVFPLHCQHLVGSTAVAQARPPTSIPELYGAWSRRWDPSTEVFASFFKHYYSLLSSLSVPESENWLYSHLAAPGVFHIHAAVLDFLEAQILPAPPAFPSSVSPDISAPYQTVEVAPNRTPRRISRVDRLRVLTSMREILHNDEACLPFWRPYALQFDRIFQVIAKNVSVYDMSGCVSLCDLIEEWLASLCLFHPRSVRQQARHAHEAVDWLFWVHVCQRMITSENCSTEIRALALLFNIWGHFPGRETAAMPLLPHVMMPYEYDLGKNSHSSSDSWESSRATTTNESVSTLTSTFSSSDSLQQLHQRRTSSPLPKFTSEMYEALAAANADTARPAAAFLAPLITASPGSIAPVPPPHSRRENELPNQLPPHYGPLSLLFCPRSMSLLGDVTLWMLSKPLWDRYFCHWNPLVRSYYQRLLVFRIASAGPSSDFIAQTDWASYHSAARALLSTRLKETYNRCVYISRKTPLAHDVGAVAPLPGRMIQIVYSGSNQAAAAEDAHHRAYPFDIFDNVAYYGHGAGHEAMHEPGFQSSGSPRRMSMSSAASSRQVSPSPSLYDYSMADSSCETTGDEGSAPAKSRKWQVFRRRRSEKHATKAETSGQLHIPSPPQLLDRRPIIQRSPYRFVLAQSGKRGSGRSCQLALPRLPFEPEPLRPTAAAKPVDKGTELLYANYGSRSLAEWNQTVRMFEDFAGRQIHLSPCLEDMVMPFLVAEIPC